MREPPTFDVNGTAERLIREIVGLVRDLRCLVQALTRKIDRDDPKGL